MGNSKSKNKNKLSKEDVDYLVANTNFDKMQIKQWHKGFLRDCPTGQLSRTKFLQVYSEFFPSGNAEEFCEHVFRTFDTDNSGRIDFSEFLLAINITSSGEPKDKLNWAFSMYDINADGTIEKKEMVQIIRAIYKMVGHEGVESDTPEDRTNQIFDKMDINKDGVLTKDEFINGCMNDEFLCRMLTADTKGPDGLK
ncbi:neuronal calcium sensor 2 [Lingula anatina]|uniref:Neuronal calcium sensor 2 n=1 Tax=Lingula anatina TaxID=7574 RepID=A0A1S3IM69_LINAN|nr:neuronal calcium sensor 2 [Lingula anatina]XP_013399329.1 neuronal calcium sensor 2 [Lingula anatina]XP_013399331.1 neuronal calcium sensor 2 [Lingula anatina]XP_013399332.1 neuronal calcium sensor 2 [Lingula anatina]XP_013399333.1 neuronal calcium sensor 2 [Lingula anatina]XP_013399334.1 neuronal calcium sensor 2 [Lingula anatina]XP_013399335.1 neuronal calcium sensor 2 [Lingula anatina]XP_013399336.1 neuronal calcium sensor 2 [Lingula anatina]XP_013399337.1 neuronal calcium sensor 2 [L|eukprot:XP_013399328.1 neuronal calcium sensor 2 [Lingula anatina]